ncbi:DUF1007 family protein [Gemmobacter serpentinus]|uniref:DUF1007 family protein n=1 Tax=Gemmobacter serpentinus TaxID=2652247 RepID=UPI0018657355|nr:DUF1007 family protein [Gemmobacter serpentinus]
MKHHRNLSLTWTLAALALFWAAPAAAHPHIWVDTGIEVIFDAEGRATALRIRWDYDEFYSLLLIEERGLDADHDGTASDAERAALQGFDMQWMEDFAGDTYAASGERPLTLSAPEGWTADYRDGRLTSSHLRRIDPPVTLDHPLRIEVYDPGYYSSYSIAYDPTFTPALPAGCRFDLQRPDPATVDRQLLDLLSRYSPDQDVEADFPAIGREFAEALVLTCG